MNYRDNILISSAMVLFLACNSSGYLDRISALKSLTSAALAEPSPEKIWFDDTDGRLNYIKGSVVISKANDETNVSQYTLYWGSSAEKKNSETAITTFDKTGGDLTYELAADTQAPTGATHLLAYAKSLAGNEGKVVAVSIVDAKSWLASSGTALSSTYFTIANTSSKVYLFNPPNKTVYEATINSDGSLTAFVVTSSPLPLAMSQASATLHNDKIYITDSSRSFTGTISGTTIAWQQGIGRDFLTCLASDGTTLFSVSGGSTTGAFSATLNAADVISSWASTIGVTSSVTSGNCAVSAQMLAYVSKKNDLSLFNERPFAITFGYKSSVIVNDAILSIGGYSPITGATIDTVYHAYIAESTSTAWSEATTKLPETRELHLSFTANGYVYVLGGCLVHNPSGICNEAKTNVWYAKPSLSGNIP